VEWLTGEMLSALISIIIIDLVLAGDNAVVIGMAARNLPKAQQKKAIVWGTVGAIIIRAIATIVVVWLLEIPGLLLVGGLLLVWIAIKLLTDEKKHDNIQAGGSLAAAIRTIVIADAVMGLDNILAVAGAAHGNFWLVIIGLAISVPVMVWGSTIIVKLLERFPVTIYIGAGVLGFTAGKMIVDEPFMKGFIGEGFLKWAIIAVITALVLIAGYLVKRSRSSHSGEKDSEPRSSQAS